PARWLEHGGVMMPMYQSEAMWISFDAEEVPGHGSPWPFAVKIAAGKTDAVTGEQWSDSIHGVPQDYLVVPEQPWLDGFCVEKGLIRQFVAMPLGSGYSAEEQITGRAEHGGLQVIVYPMKKEAFERRFPKVEMEHPRMRRMDLCCDAMATPDMGLAPGGKMRQEIYEDPFGFEDWDRKTSSRCFVHIANSLVWRAITGQVPPTVPPTAKEYSAAGLPWFDYYNDGAEALEGSEELAKLKSVIQLGNEKGDNPLPENRPARAERIIVYRKGLAKWQVREGTF
ncbi:MAG TPA: hypothetical protein VLA34_10195, partial [Candidatus Krumholzibacterium sp.]|nr:hypothetical protein [Candidatus Krumholzibacterium sp.]